MFKPNDKVKHKTNKDCPELVVKKPGSYVTVCYDMASPVYNMSGNTFQTHVILTENLEVVCT